MNSAEHYQSELAEIGVDIEELKEAAKTLDVLAPLAMPDTAVLPWPNFYKALWARMTIACYALRGSFRYALGFPRGFCKTTFIKIFVLFLILFTRRKFILVIGANLEKAIEILADVQDMLDSGNIQAVFGNWRVGMETDKKELKKFSFNGRPVVLMAAGQGTAIRGANVKNQRPDTIILDDAQTREGADSIEEAKKFKIWFHANVMKLKAPTGCLYFYIGNMYPDKEIVPGQYTCMLRNLQMSQFWESYITGGILQDGTSLWEELHPVAELKQEFQMDLAAGTPQTFCSEILNDPKAIPLAGLDFSKIRRKIKIPGEPHTGSFIIIDLATDKKGSDAQVIHYHEVYDGVPTSVELLTGHWSPSGLICAALELSIRRGCKLIGVESDAYQYSLLHWFEFICAQQGIQGINFVPIYSRGIAKNSRILAAIRTMMEGKYQLTDATFSLIVAELSAFDPVKKNNVDNILDTVAYAPGFFAEYAGLMVVDIYQSGETAWSLQGIPSPDSFLEEQAF